jgi:uncharacterized protein YecT (DUF1311 family)
MSFMKILIAFLSFSVIPACMAADSFCDTGKPHPIDLNYEKSLNEGKPEIAAQELAYKEWDKALNLSYRELMSTLKPEDKELLKRSQRDWVSYRDSQAGFWGSSAMYGAGGSIGRMTAMDLVTGLLRQRTCELMSYKKIVYKSPGS